MLAKNGMTFVFPKWSFGGMNNNNSLKTLAVIVLMLVFATGCTKPDTPNNGGNGSDQNDSIVEPNHGGDSIDNLTHDWVDLGLPSGTLWATCNVGADTPEGIGDYFAWGETSPKDLYDWKSYKYGNWTFEQFEMTKYCTDSCYGLDGFVDNLTLLEPKDDAAAVNWGDDWRMPTKEEWEELYQKTTWTWTDINGVMGRLLNGTNGNSLFLPATGFRLDGELICLGLGIYWSSTLHSHFPERGWSYHFDWESSHVCGTYERSRGQIVRAVRVVK